MSEDFPAHLGGFRPGSILAGYRLEAHVAAGGMGVVFRARDGRLGRVVALKILAPALAADPAFRRRFIAESRAAATVDDPHIIPVYEADEADGVLFIAMRFVAGGDLRRVLEREGMLAPDRAAEFISPVASALDAAHAAGLVHRDVKPGNILVDARAGRPDHVYLSDFGASKGAMTSVSLTGQGFLGTPDYAAPEQINGLAVDGRTDQYALACVAFRLLAGVPPFERDHGMAVLLAHLSAPPPSLTARRPDLPGGADEVLASGMAKTPDQRYASCGDFADALREALGVAPYHPRGFAAAAAHPLPLVAVPTEISPPQAAGNGKAAGLADQAGTVTIGPPELSGDEAAARVEPAAREPAPPRAAPATVAAGAPGVTRPVAAVRTGKTSWLRRRRLPAIAVGCAIVVAAGVIPFVLTSAANTPKPGNSPKPTQSVTRSPAGQSASTSASSASTGPPPVLLASPDGAANAVAFSPGGTTVAVGGYGNAYLWDVATRTISVTLTDPDFFGVDSVAFGPGGTTLAVGEIYGDVYLWDVATRTISATLTDPDFFNADSMAFGPGGTTLAVGYSDGHTYVWDVATQTISATLTNPDGSAVNSVAFSPNGTTLAAGDSDGHTYLWDVATQTISATLTDPDRSTVTSVAFRPGSTTLAVGSIGGITYLWDVATETISGTLTDPDGSAVDSVTFRPSGTTLAAGDSDGHTYLWDVATQTISATLTDPDRSTVNSVAFSPGGTTLAVADLNGNAYLWDVARYTS